MKMNLKRIAMALIAMAMGSAMANEASVKALLAKKYSSLSSDVIVKKLGVADLYEVNLLGQEAYTNERVDFLLVGGSLVDAATLEDVTVKRRPQLLRDFFLGLPLDNAIKSVYGKGERVVVSFEDPDCPLCREQHAEWAKDSAVLNVTVYAFMFPLKNHPDARRKAEFIWCQPDPAAAWRAWMVKGQGLPLEAGSLAKSAPASCAAGVAKVGASEALARSLNYHSTPRFIFANGAGATGVLTRAQFEAALNSVEKSLAAMPPPAAPAAAKPTPRGGSGVKKAK